MASRDDEVVPVELSQNLGKRFGGNCTFLLLEGCGHNEIIYKRKAQESLRTFINGI